jgi:hypothetical protein
MTWHKMASCIQKECLKTGKQDSLAFEPKLPLTFIFAWNMMIVISWRSNPKDNIG